MSLKPCAFSGQTLNDHTTKVVKTVDELFNDKGYAELVKNRLMKLGIETSSDVIREIVRIAAAFHDIGKAFSCYQTKFDDSCNCVLNECSFKYHEILSALILHRYLKKRKELNYNLKMYAVLAVLNHMHAIRDYSEYRPFNSLKNSMYSYLRGGLTINEEHIASLSNMLSTILEEDVNILAECMRNVKLDEINELVQAIDRWISGNRASKMYVLILTPLIVSDNIESYRSRRRDRESASRRRFMNELANAIGIPLSNVVNDKGVQRHESG